MRLINLPSRNEEALLPLIANGRWLTAVELQNWRPMTLLNVDCKIAAKTIAKRIEVVLPDLIHLDQTGFAKGRRRKH